MQVEIKDKYPEKTVLYIQGNFTHNILTRLRKTETISFIFYQLIDVLIIDDVSGKSGTQDVFSIFSIILHQNGKGNLDFR
jgi:chromosomal replication initiation ATPase DnaA